MTTVVAFAGQIGSGKSTISRRVAEILNHPYVSFSAAVRVAAAERDIPDDRRSLQELGDALISGGWEPFCRKVLDQLGDSTVAPVVDGVRHIGAVTALRGLVAPLPLRLVYLEVPEIERLSRLHSRGLSPSQIAAADRHRNESELPLVRAAADLVVSNDEDVDEVSSAIIEALAQLM